MPGKAIGALDDSLRRLRRDTRDDRWCSQHGPRHRNPRRRGRPPGRDRRPRPGRCAAARRGPRWPPGTSSAEEVQQLVPQGTPVVKAFNTTFAGTLVVGEVNGQQLDVLIAGGDEAAKDKVSRLAADGGL